MSVSEQAREAHDSDWFDRLARAGLVAYAVIYLVVGWLAVQLALGDHEGKPSSTGALKEVSQQSLGDLLIWVVAIGMFLLVLWKALDAIVGHREEQDRGKRTRKRLASAAKASSTPLSPSAASASPPTPAAAAARRRPGRPP